MNEGRFVADRAQRWAELRALLARAQARGPTSLSGDEARRLGALYRAATTDLAEARTFGLSEATVSNVNRLCGAAHDLVYAGHRGRGVGVRAASFLAVGFPALVRRTWRFHAFAAAAMILPGVAAFLALRGDPDLAERTLGPVFQERAERALAAPEEGRRYFELSAAWAPFLSWGIMANNVFVSLVGFALGAAGLVGGLWFLANNGVSIGGGLAVFHHAGVPGVMWTFVAAHGPLELTAIFIAAGAGLRLGLSVLVPGRRSRAAAFRATGVESVGLLLGTSSMLVVAGIFEGFLSPSAAPAAVKWAVGAASVAFLTWYFGFAGRKSGANGR